MKQSLLKYRKPIGITIIGIAFCMVLFGFYTKSKIEPNTAVSAEVKVKKPKYHVSKRQMDCLVKNAFYEANTQGTVGRILVTNVVINRSKATGESFCSVVYAPYQFSWTLFKVKPIPRSSYLKIRKEIKRFLNSEIEIPEYLGSATHYHEKSIRPFWIKSSKRLGMYKDHIFYNVEA
jgi:N-acetylmuramoyl-L-alanine amidase